MRAENYNARKQSLRAPKMRITCIVSGRTLTFIHNDISKTIEISEHFLTVNPATVNSREELESFIKNRPGGKIIKYYERVAGAFSYKGATYNIVIDDKGLVEKTCFFESTFYSYPDSLGFTFTHNFRDNAKDVKVSYDGVWDPDPKLEEMTIQAFK